MLQGEETSNDCVDLTKTMTEVDEFELTPGNTMGFDDWLKSKAEAQRSGTGVEQKVVDEQAEAQRSAALEGRFDCNGKYGTQFYRDHPKSSSQYALYMGLRGREAIECHKVIDLSMAVANVRRPSRKRFRFTVPPRPCLWRGRWDSVGRNRCDLAASKLCARQCSA